MILFNGLVKLTLEKHFKGRGGQAVITAIGISLSISMSVAEVTFGFNLSSLGGVGGTIFAVLCGIIFFYILNSIEISKPTSFSWAFILTYVLFNSISLELSELLKTNFPITDLIFICAVIFAVVKLIYFLLSGVKIKQKEFSKKIKTLKNPPLQEVKLHDDFITEESEALKSGRNISSNIVKQLYEMVPFIDEYTNSPRQKKALIDQLNSITSKESRLLQKHLKDLDEKLSNLDVLAMKKLEKQYKEVPKEMKVRILKEIQTEKRKYNLVNKLKKLERAIISNVDDFYRAIKKCIDDIDAGNIPEAKKCVMNAISQQKKMDQIFKDMKTIGNFMKGLSKREYKDLKYIKKAR